MIKERISRVFRKIAPRTVQNLTLLSELNEGGDGAAETLLQLELEIRSLRSELNEMRRDNRRMAELYDLVFERLRSEYPLKK